MAIVVSDTTPLHYLIHLGCENILRDLYGQVYVPPAVLAELTHASAPVVISAWATNPPQWIIAKAPSSSQAQFEELDFGERQALALAVEIHSDVILLDDKLARRIARSESLCVKGTLGVLADAAKAGLIDFVATLERLQQSSIHLDQSLIDAVLLDYQRWRQENKPPA